MLSIKTSDEPRISPCSLAQVEAKILNHPLRIDFLFNDVKTEGDMISPRDLLPDCMKASISLTCVRYRLVSF